LKYNNASQNPNTTDRLVNVKVNDGTLDSNTAVATVHVAAVNDAPVVVVSGTFTPVPEGTTRTYTYTVTDRGDPDNCGTPSPT
jgi:hypothetical protein